MSAPEACDRSMRCECGVGELQPTSPVLPDEEAELLGRGTEVACGSFGGNARESRLSHADPTQHSDLSSDDTLLRATQDLDHRLFSTRCQALSACWLSTIDVGDIVSPCCGYDFLVGKHGRPLAANGLTSTT